jgi:RNA polymerase sigma-70 factor (ECF subfamily)
MLRRQTEAEDAAQEALVKAVTNLHTFDVTRPFKPWMLRIASNECLDRLRRRKPIVSLDGLGEDGAWEWKPGESPNPEAEFLKHEKEEQIRALLDVLSPLDRNVVTLFYWEGLSYAEISEMTSLSISAIKSRLFRARRAMAEQLEAVTL